MDAMEARGGAGGGVSVPWGLTINYASPEGYGSIELEVVERTAT